MPITISYATPTDAPLVATFAKALTDEIIERTGTGHFNVDLAATTQLARHWLEEGTYCVLLAVDSNAGQPVGFATLCASHALYAAGSFGIVQEFYILPEYRSRRVGARLLEQAAVQARDRGWQRLELCTPPLPEFERTLEFYQANGFEVTGGRKMKRVFARG